MAGIYERTKSEVSRFFPSCPLCQKNSIALKWNAGRNGEDYVACSDCNAKWHIYYFRNLKWAKLIEAGSSGKGDDHLWIEHEPNFWFDMIEKKPVKNQIETEKQQPIVREIVREKEVIKEKEVIYKVKCPYCGKLYNEVLDVCPHCGGKR